MPRPNRRLGERRNIQPSQIHWNLPKQGWKQRFKKQEAQVGILQDVSVTGAAVVAPLDGQVGRGSRVPVAFGWVEGAVRVIRVDPHPDGINATFGVEWESSDSEFTRAVLQTFLESDTPPY